MPDESAMKKSTFFYLIFLYVLLFLVIAPIVFQFFGGWQEVIEACYPFSVFFNASIAFLIYTFSIKGLIFEKPIERERLPFFVYSANVLLCFGFLLVSSCVFEAVSYFLKISGGLHEVIFPSSILGWLNFFFGVICAAFFEEAIYRFYLPRAFREIFGNMKFFHNADKKNNLRLLVLCEAFPLFLFSLGHIYLGIFGFFNALLCGAALRLCMVRTKSLWISFAIHSAYNFLSFLMIFILM